MVITRKNQVLLNFLDVRVVVNGQLIYPLHIERPVVIPLSQQPFSIVATDGFHITNPVKVECFPRQTRHLNIVCAIDDGAMFVGIVLLLFFALLAFNAEIQLLKWLSFMPVLYFIFTFYIRRKKYIQIKTAT